MSTSESKNRPLVLAVGADGKFAGLVVPELAKRGAEVRGLVHRAEHKDAVLGNGAAEVAVGGLTDAASLKAFAQAEGTSGVPGLDQPGINIAWLARGYGCQSQCAETPDEVSDVVRAAFAHDGPTIIEVPISPAPPSLL